MTTALADKKPDVTIIDKDGEPHATVICGDEIFSVSLCDNLPEDRVTVFSVETMRFTVVGNEDLVVIAQDEPELARALGIELCPECDEDMPGYRTIVRGSNWHNAVEETIPCEYCGGQVVSVPYMHSEDFHGSGVVNRECTVCGNVNCLEGDFCHTCNKEET